MSKIAILSDIHSNLPALQAVLSEIETIGAGRIIFLGDTIGYGASPAECVDWVRKLGGECVMGNHDIAIKRLRMRGRQEMGESWKTSGYAAGLVHSAESLGGERASWLEGLPFTLRIPGAVVAHANLHEPEGFDYISDAASAAPTLRKLMEESHMTGFFGHTHMQEVFCDPYAKIDWFDDVRFHIPADVPCAVMVGSVGQPRHPSDRRAAWVLWDSETREVEFRKTEYSRLQAAQDIVKVRLPLESAMRVLTDAEETILLR
jgi:predicted phosphodiesterase